MESLQQSQKSAGSFLHQIYDKTVEELSEIIQKIKSNLDSQLQEYMKIFKQGLRAQIIFLQAIQKNDELIEKFMKLKEQIRNNRTSLLHSTQGFHLEIRPKFELFKAKASNQKQNEEIEQIQGQNQTQDKSKYEFPSCKQIKQKGQQEIEEIVINDERVQKSKKKHKKFNIKCPDCSKSFFENRNQFIIHLSTFHNKILKYQCPACSQSDSDYTKLAEHLLENHQINVADQMTLICPFTQKDFTDPIKLAHHIRSNHQYRIFQMIDQ